MVPPTVVLLAGVNLKRIEWYQPVMVPPTVILLAGVAF